MPDASVIIPTFNRRDSLLVTLDTLATQRKSDCQFEVIVVDDGSTDGTQIALAERTYPFELRYLYQRNRGSAIARNTGAGCARADILIFVDDDMALGQEYVAELVNEHRTFSGVVSMGTELPHIVPDASPYARIMSMGAMSKSNVGATDSHFVDFTHCVTNNLSVQREDFFDVGGMQDVAGDGPTWWGDVDFGYRALCAGLVFRQSGRAQCIHRDYSMQNFSTACDRQFRVAKMAVQLAQKYPGILEHLPMFDDKTPIVGCRNNPHLVARKMARRAVSTHLSIRVMEKLIAGLERWHPVPWALRPLYRWVLGGYVYRGFQEGLCLYGSIRPVENQVHIFHV